MIFIKNKFPIGYLASLFTCVAFLTCVPELPFLPLLNPLSDLSYNVSDTTLTLGQKLDSLALAYGLSPTYDGDLADSFTISPVLPESLFINHRSGTIFGKPTKISSKTKYTIVGYNNSGYSTDTFLLSIAVKDSIHTNDSFPSFTLQPTNTLVALGDSVSISVSAFGNPAPTYTWYKNNAVFPSSMLPVLHFQQVSYLDSGVYFCVITNNKGKDTSNLCTLSVSGAAIVKPSIDSIVPNKSEKFEGDSVVFKIYAKGTSPIHYKWVKNNTVIGGDSSSLSLKNLAITDAGVYNVKIWNSADSAVKACTLKVDTQYYPITVDVQGKGSVTPIPQQGQVKVRRGSKQLFSFKADVGFHLDSVIVNGKADTSSISNNQYSFDSVLAPGTLKVVFKANVYILQVKSDSGIVSRIPNVNSFGYGDTVRLIPKSKSGYYFAGWSGDTTASDSIVKITFYKDRSVIANFVRIGSLSLNITSVNGIVSKAPDSTSYKYGDQVALTALPSAGYSFVSWSGAATGTTSPVTIAMDGSKSVTANFSPKVYSITYNLNSGTNGSNPATYTIESLTLTLANATRSGYTFDGWFDNSGLIGTAIPSISIGSTGIKEYWAKWTPITYSITYNLNSGTNGSNPTSYTIATSTITLANATRSGYTFGGWFANQELTVTAENSIPLGTTGNKIFWAKFTPTSYTITYNLNNGTNGSNPTTYTIESSQISLANATRTGYTFGGWYENAMFSGSAIPSIATGSTGAKTFWAKWVPRYTLTFASNPVNAWTLPSAITVDSAVPVSINCVANSNYLFQNWAPGVNATVTASTQASTTATLSGNATITANCLVGPSVTAPSAPAKSMVGDTISLTVTASGSASLSYQWYRNGSVLVGATSATLLRNFAQPADSGSYYVAVTNPVGTVNSSPAVLNVRRIVKVSIGNNHMLILKSDGTLWGVGDNSISQSLLTGALGDADMTTRLVPQQMASDVKTMAAGPHFSLIVKNNGSLFVCGLNTFGQLGTGDTLTKTTLTPVSLGSSAGPIKQISAGGYGTVACRSLAVTTTGQLWGWGDTYGEDNVTNPKIPNRLLSTHGLFSSVTAGYSTIVAIDANGTGYQYNGVAGCPGSLYFNQITGDLLGNISAFAAGKSTMLFIDKNGLLKWSGTNNFGEISTPYAQNVCPPSSSAINVIGIGSGYEYTAFIKSDSTLWTQGKTTNGQLGHTSGGSTDGPALIGDNVASVTTTSSTSSGKTMFIKNDGTLWGCGAAPFGDGELANQLTPIWIRMQE